MLLQAGSVRHRGKFPMFHKTVGSGGGEEAVAFPTEGQEHNLGGATANHLEKKNIRHIRDPKETDNFSVNVSLPAPSHKPVLLLRFKSCSPTSATEYSPQT